MSSKKRKKSNFLGSGREKANSCMWYNAYMNERQKRGNPGIPYTEKSKHQTELSKNREWPRNKIKEASGPHEL